MPSAQAARIIFFSAARSSPFRNQNFAFRNVTIAPAMAWTRREFMRGLAATGLVGVSAASTYASLVEPRAYELTETDIPIRDLPSAFDGFRIAHVSDLHYSP